MRTFLKITVASALVLLGASGCIMEPSSRQEQLGIIQILPAFPAEVGVPQTAEVGEPFVVSVVTHGGGCLQAGPTRVRRDGMAADVRPYDIDLGERVCTGEVVFYQHVATLEFNQPGLATVRFHGYGQPGGEIITVTRTVDIQ